jgi:hypothetical protein
MNHLAKSLSDRRFIEMKRRTPKFFSLLSDADKSGYFNLQQQLLLLTEHRRRGHRLETILDCFRMIHSWAQRGDGDDWRRCCVCGLFYLQCGIAVNSHQLNSLTDRCKSSINGGLKRLGYGTISARGDMNPELVRLLPYLKGNTHELRQWSVRKPKNYDESPPPCCIPAPQETSHDPSQGKIDDCDLSLTCFLNPDQGSFLSDWDPERQHEF